VICAVAVLLGSGVVACTSEQPPGTPAPPPVLVPGRPGEPNRVVPPEEAGGLRPDAPPSEADLHYARQMITHHQQALEMSALAAQRSTREDVRGLAARITDSQGPEITVLTTWLRRHGQQPGGTHHGVDPAGMPGMATPDQLATLRAAGGTDFDRLFLRLMTAHHEGAVTMATQVLSTGTDVYVEEMARDVIATQTDEIARMRAISP
jgi:uncharacterized protein (DUF305 family)